jgi:hypothetical protein
VRCDDALISLGSVVGYATNLGSEHVEGYKLCLRSIDSYTIQGYQIHTSLQ